MSENKNLRKAKSAKNDEFYTQYQDIEKEMQAYLEFDPNVFRDKTVLLPCDDPEWSNFTKYFAQNFERFGLKKLISTSYAYVSKHLGSDYEPSLLEVSSEHFDEGKNLTNGKIFTLTEDINNDSKIDINDLSWEYLEGDGDFRSDEVIELCDEADIIITNPPFSLFRDFLASLISTGKQFAIIGNLNAITYKDVFPLLRDNEMWLGATISSGDREFRVPDSYPLDAASFRVDDEGKKYIRVKGVRWFTNIDHGRRHQPLQLMTMDDNIRYNKKIKKKPVYEHYYNYDAIEVSFTDAIPSEYTGDMGVPISFLDKYCPEQFQIIGLGISSSGREVGVEGYTPEHKEYRKNVQKRGAVDGDLYMIEDGEVKVPYARILIKHKKQL